MISYNPTDSSTTNCIATEIESTFTKNSIEDLHKLIRNRACLNNCNICFTYLSHFLQTCGIIITSLYASYDNYKVLLWIGIGLNASASLVSIYEKTNLAFSEKMLEDIKKIRAGDYIDESTIITIKAEEKK